MGVMDEKTVKVAAKLYEARDALRRLWGAEYPKPALTEAMEGLRRATRESGLPVLEVALRAAQVCEEQGRGQRALLYLTAAVEIVEPSKEARP